jgi:translation initiation factor IF-2
MGHIDHGKSTLLDYVRKTNIVAGEAGGITQHIGAYQVEYTTTDGKKNLITFLDTPGHEAFCNIRERGARAADIAILVVSAEDGVKPQTVEAYKNIVAEKIPYVVAITKIDKPNANIEKTKQSLGENEIYVEGWGGDIPCVAISAVTGKGIPELFEMVMLVAELAVLKTNPSSPTIGIIIESTLDTRKGISATLLIKDGTLSTGSFVIADKAFAPVRFIENFKGEKIESATASMPVKILGWNTIPACGSKFITVASKKIAEKMVEECENEIRRTMCKTSAVPTVATKNTESDETDKVVPEIIILPIIVKADVIGSLEGIKHELAKISHEKVQIKIIAEGIGSVNENDVKMAQGDPNILVIGFNAAPDKKASAIIERAPVPIKIKLFSVIYELSAYVQETLTAMVPKEYIEEMTGRAKILALFSKEKDRQVIGGKVETGTIGSGNDIRIMRREAEIGRGKIRELQSKKLRVTEVTEGFEFGMMVEAKIEIAAGDRIEAVHTVEKKG